MEQASFGREPQIGSDRGFGLLVGAILLVIGARGALIGRFYAGPVLLFGAALIVAAAALPRVLAPLNRAWFRLGLLLGRIVAPVVMAAVFAIVVVPTGLGLRLFRKDPLRLRGRDAASFWIPRTTASAFRDQF